MPAPRRATPHLREFLADELTPLGVYRRLACHSPRRFLLESVTGGDRISRFSFLGGAPREVYRLYPDRLEILREGTIRTAPAPPLAALRAALSAVSAGAPAREADGTGIPFAGGFVGTFGYDLARLTERLPGRPPDPFGLPVALLARFDDVVVFDHARQRVLAVANAIEGERDPAAAEESLDELENLLTAGSDGGAVALPRGIPERSERSHPAAMPSLEGADFRRAVGRAMEHIVAGDIFQVVLARRWRLPAPATAEPLALYRALRLINPSPYMVLYEAPELALIGASPEMLVRRAGARIETRPIAGTRRRGVDPDEDRSLAADLLADAKERAEHVMLVDLGRNDLGRVARAGTVNVASFMEVERYSHVMHLVSGVEAELAPGRDALDALLACFPAGTVSGAPKIRAMEIIDELEPEARGPYGGAVGYLSYGGDLDTCITIRTLLMHEGEVSVTAGAGIVADSDPEREERETESKAAALLAAVDLAASIAGRGAPARRPASASRAARRGA